MSATHVAVLGAGPGGLSMAWWLMRLGLRVTLLERGPQVLWSLRQVDPEMALLSPKVLSCLAGQRARSDDPTYLPFGLLVERFDEHAHRSGLEARTGREVVGVRREGHGFLVRSRLADGRIEDLEATHVVNATGVIAHPHLPPDYDAGVCRLRALHSLRVRSADVAAARRLLVVGAGASAAEVLDRWLLLRAEGAQALLSVRERLYAMPNPLLGIDLHYLIWAPEHLPVGPFGARLGALPEPMNSRHLRPALRDGRVRRVPGVRRYAADHVELCDGSTHSPDLLVFATGFRYDVAHLAGLVDLDPDSRPIVRGCQSLRAPGLFLLGTRFGRTLASPYLRGLPRDARHVAERIAAGAGSAA